MENETERKLIDAEMQIRMSRACIEELREENKCLKDRLNMDKGKLHSELTELVARKFHLLAEYMEEQTPFDDIDPEGWRGKYLGVTPPDLPKYAIVYNKFKPEVDCFVAAILRTIEGERCQNI